MTQPSRPPNVSGRAPKGSAPSEPGMVTAPPTKKVFSPPVPWTVDLQGEHRTWRTPAGHHVQQERFVKPRDGVIGVTKVDIPPATGHSTRKVVAYKFAPGHFQAEKPGTSVRPLNGDASQGHITTIVKPDGSGVKVIREASAAGQIRAQRAAKAAQAK